MAPKRAYRMSPSTDIITYRYNGKLVYVPVASNYMQALQHAREAFQQLQRLRSDDTVSLSLSAPTGCDGREYTFVRISESAWPNVIMHLTRYQIIDVHIEKRDSSVLIPDIKITYADANDVVQETEPVPPYRMKEEDDRNTVVDDEMATSHTPTRMRTVSQSGTSSVLHPKRSWFSPKRHG